MASISRYPDVIHWTVAVPMPNSFIRVGNVIFIAVSTTTPQKDMIPAATTEKMTCTGIRGAEVWCSPVEQAVLVFRVWFDNRIPPF